jgi:hypothetical protein
MSSGGLEERVHLLGIRHHGPGSAALVRQALDALDPECVLIEGAPEADELIRFVSSEGMRPPVALLLHAADDANAAVFLPFAEFSPEWQAMLWAVQHSRAVHFCDWPAAVSLALTLASAKEKPEEGANASGRQSDPDPLDQMAEAAGYGDGEAFWNVLIEQYGGRGGNALELFRAIEAAMTEARGIEVLNDADALKQSRREAYMRTRIREAMQDHAGTIAVICGAWHVSALRSEVSVASDKALLKNLPKVKVQATWVPWTDSRLSVFTGYGAGVLSPGWYGHLWGLYTGAGTPSATEFAAVWQAKTAGALRAEGFSAPAASAIEATRLALGLAAMRGLSLPGLVEMRDATLAAMCHGDALPMILLEQKLYIGEQVGAIGDDVPQMPLARDLAAWQKKTRLKTEDIDVEVRVDLRSEAGLLKSTLLHRLTLIEVPWGRLIEAETGRGTFREVWRLRWMPELSVALAEALIYGVTIEQASGNAARERAKGSTSVTEVADLIRAALVADLAEAATDCISCLQALAMRASDLTDLMQAVAPLVRVLRYGTARKLPEEALRALIVSLSAEVNAGVRTGSHGLDEETAAKRVQAMQQYDEAVLLFGDEGLAEGWRVQLGAIVEDTHVAALVAGLSLRRLHDGRHWEMERVGAAFSRQMSGHAPQHSGAFLEGFLSGGAEVILHDSVLLRMVDAWLSEINDQDFVESLPLLRRSLSGFDSVSRRRLMELVKQSRKVVSGEGARVEEEEDNPAFAAALPLLCQILGIRMEKGQ